MLIIIDDVVGNSTFETDCLDILESNKKKYKRDKLLWKMVFTWWKPRFSRFLCADDKCSK